MKQIKTKEKILNLLRSRHDYSVAKLVKKLKLSNQIIHRHLKDLQIKKYYQNLNLGLNYWEIDFKRAKGFIMVK